MKWIAISMAVMLLLASGGAAQRQPASSVVTLSSFADQNPPPAPDYSRASNWAARPGAEGKAALVPRGATPAARHPRADVFYIHPTTLRSRDRWNADIADADTNHWTDISAVARQASIFNACCRIFAPRYRQAGPAAFAAMGGEGDEAYDLAYGDVVRAFDRYVAQDNDGRPFILVGHSQGALLAKRLLAERIEGTPIARRMVVAYIVGVGISQGDFGKTFHATPACSAPRETGCILGWNSFLAGNDTAAYRLRTTAAYRARFGEQGAEMLCSNPLAFGGGEGKALGALPGDARDGPLQALVPNAVTAQCADGVLMVRPTASLALKPLPGGMMHYHDLSMFYADIRADAVRRIDAFLARGTRFVNGGSLLRRKLPGLIATAPAATSAASADSIMPLPGVLGHLSRLPPPTLLVNADHGNDVKYGEGGGRLIPRSRRMTVVGAGSFVHQEKPRETADAIDQLLAEHD